MSPWALAEREPNRQPSRRFSLQIGDFVVIAIVFGGVFAASANLLGVSDMPIRIALVIGWVSAAAKRIVAWRHCGHQQVVVQGDARAIALVIGVVPWFVLPLLHARFHDWAIWSPMSFPLVCRVAGGGLMAYGVFKPFLAPRSAGLSEDALVLADYSSHTYLTFDALFHATGLFLLTASPLIGTLVVCWIGLTASLDRINAVAARLQTYVSFTLGPTITNS